MQFSRRAVLAALAGSTAGCQTPGQEDTVTRRIGGRGGAFADTNGDGIAELQEDHADMDGGDLRNARAVGAEGIEAVADVVIREGDDPQTKLDSAPAEAVVAFDPTYQFTIETTITVTTAGLTIQNAHVRYDDGAMSSVDDHQPMWEIRADNVTFERFRLDGNKENQNYNSGTNSSNINVSDCRGVTIRNGVSDNAVRHGVIITGGTADVYDATVENVEGSDNARDLVSLEGRSDNFNPTARNLRGYGSATRGTLEIADGVQNGHVEDVYGEDQSYVVSHEDHGNHVNKNNVFEHIRGKNVGSLVNNGSSGNVQHEGLTVRDVTGTAETFNGNAEAVHISHTDSVRLEDIRITGLNEKFGVRAQNATGATLVDAVAGENTATVDQVSVIDCDDVTVRGGAGYQTDGHGLHIKETDGATHTDFLISGFRAENTGKENIEFEGDLTNMSVVNSKGNITNGTASGTVEEAGNI